MVGSIQNPSVSYEPYAFVEKDPDAEKQTKRRDTIIAIAVLLLGVGALVGGVMYLSYGHGANHQQPARVIAAVSATFGGTVVLFCPLVLGATHIKEPPVPRELQPVRKNH